MPCKAYVAHSGFATAPHSVIDATHLLLNLRRTLPTQDGERLVLVQEWAARGDLLNVTSQLGGRIPEAQAARAVVAPFLDALAYLHAKVGA